MATEDDVLQKQSALAEKMEKEDRELLTIASGVAVKLSQVEEKKLEIFTGEPHEIKKTTTDVESIQELVAGDSGAKHTGKFSESPMPSEVAGEENSCSAQEYKSKDMINEANGGESKKDLLTEEDSQYQEIEITSEGASHPETKTNAEEESSDLNRVDAGCIVQEETILDPKEATSAETTGLKDHCPDSTQDINLDTAKLLMTCKQDAGTNNTSTASLEDLHETGRSIEEEKDSSISSVLNSKKMKLEGLNPSQNMQDERTKEVEILSQYTGYDSTETAYGKQQGETTKGNLQDAEKLLRSVNMEDETTKKEEISSDPSETVSIEIESTTDDSGVIEGTRQDAKIVTHCVILEHETSEKVQSLSEHTTRISAEAECDSDPSKVTNIEIQDAEILPHYVEVESEKIEKAGSSSCLARNAYTEPGSGSNYIEATKEEISEDLETLPGNSLSIPSIKDTSTRGAEAGKTNNEVKSADDTTEEENLGLKISDLGSASFSISSDADCPNKHEKENVENDSCSEQVNSPFINASTEDMLLRDAALEKVQELVVHSGTISEKEGWDTEDTLHAEPVPVKEVSDMVPIDAQEDQPDAENQKKFPEKVVTVRSTEIAEDKAEERPESSSNDSVMKQEEALREDRQNEVSKGSTEANIKAQETVGPELKHLENILPQNEPGKESYNESLQSASMSLEKIDSNEHSETATSIEEQRSIECLEGLLGEEKDSTNDASKSTAQDSLQENATIAGSNKEVNIAILNDAVDYAGIRGKVEYTNDDEEIRGNDSEDVTAEPREYQITVEEPDQDTFSQDEERESQIKVKEQGVTENSVEEALDAEKHKSNDEAADPETDDVHKGEVLYRNGNDEIKVCDPEEGAQELKENQIVPEEASSDTFSSNVEKEMQITDREKVVIEYLAESSVAEGSKSDYKVKTEATTPGDNDVHKVEAVYSNNEEETKDDHSEEGAPKPEAHKNEERGTQIIDKEGAPTEYMVESSIAEEKEPDSDVTTEAKNPQADDINKGEAAQISDDEGIKEKEQEAVASEQKQDMTAAEKKKDILIEDEEIETEKGKEKVAAECLVESSIVEKHKSDHEIRAEATSHEADNVYEGEAVYSNDTEEGTPELEEDQILTKEAQKDEEKETQITKNEEVATEYLVESSLAGEKKSDHKAIIEATNIEADDVHKGEVAQANDDEGIEYNDPDEENACNKDEGKETEIIDKEKVVAECFVESSVVEDKPVREDRIEATDPATDDVREGEAASSNDVEEEAPVLKEDQILTEQAHKDEETETEIMDKKVATVYLVESSVAEEKKHCCEVTTEVDQVNDDKRIKCDDPEEVAPDLKEDQIEAKEVQKDTLNKDEETETKTIEKEKVVVKCLVESSVVEKDKPNDKVRTEETKLEADDVHEGEAVYRNDTEEGAGVLKEDQILIEQEYKDEERETELIDKEEVAMEYSVETSVAEENKSDHKVTTEATNPEAEETDKGEVDQVNDSDRIKCNDPEHVAADLKEDQSAAKEIQKDTFSKDEDKETQTIEKEKVVAECLVEPSVVEKDKLEHEIGIEATSLEADDVHEGAVYRNDTEEGAPVLKEDQILTEQAQKDEERETKLIDKEEIATEYLVESYKERKAKLIEKEEIATEYLVESSVAEENKSGHEVTTEATNPEAEDASKREEDQVNDSGKIKCNDAEHVAPDPKEDQSAAKEVERDTLSKDEEKETETIEKEKVVAERLVESSVVEKEKPDHEVRTEAANLEADDVHEGEAVYSNDTEEGAPAPKEDQILTEQAHQDEERETQIIDEELATSYLVESSVAEENKPDGEVTTEVQKDFHSMDKEKEMQAMDNENGIPECLVESFTEQKDKSCHEIKNEATNPEAENVHRGEAVYSNDYDEEEAKGNDSEEAEPDLKEDHILVQEAHKDEEKETLADKEEVAIKCLVESSIAEEAKSDHKVTDPEADDVYEGEAIHINDDEEIKGNDPVEVATDPKKDLSAAEEVQMDIFSKGEEEEEEVHTKDKEKIVAECLVASLAEGKDMTDNDVKTQATNHRADDAHKGETVYSNDSDEGAHELEESQTLREEARKNEEEEMKIIDEKEGATGCLVESSVAEENNNDHEVTTEAKNLEADDVHKGKAAHTNDDKENESNDPEVIAPESKENQITAEQVQRDTVSKDEEKEIQKIEKVNVIAEYLVESAVAENEKSDHEVKTEATNSEGDALERGVDDINAAEQMEGNDPEKVADQIVEEEEYKDTFSKDEDKEKQIIDKQKVVAELLVESSVPEQDKSDHEVETKATNAEAGDFHNSAENIDKVEDRKTQTKPREYICKDIVAEGNIVTQVPNQEETKEELGAEHYFATLPREEINKEDSRQENREEELDREKIPEAQDYNTTSLKEEIVQQSFQEDEENKHTSADSKMNTEESLDLAIPTPIDGEISVERRLEQEESDVLEPEKETKEMDIDNTAQNDEATHSRHEGEMDTVKREIYADIVGDTVGTIRLVEYLPPCEFQGQAEKSSAMPEISEESKEKVLDESTKIRSIQGSLKQEDRDVLELEKQTKDVNIEGRTKNLNIEGIKQNDEVTLSTNEGKKERVKHEENADAADTDRSAEAFPPEEYHELAQSSSPVPEISEKSKEKTLGTVEPIEMRPTEGSLKLEDWDVMETEKERRNLDIQGIPENDEASHCAQEGEKEMVEHEGNADAVGADGLTEGLPWDQELAENSITVPEIFYHIKEKMSDTKESTEIRPAEGSLKQEEWDVMVPEKETKDFNMEGTIENDEAKHSAQAGEIEMVNHKGNADAAGTNILSEGLPLRDQELAEDSSTVPEISEGSTEKMFDAQNSTQIKSVGELKQVEWDILEPEKEIENVDIDSTASNDEAIHSAAEGQPEIVQHEENADVAGTDKIAKGLCQIEYQEIAENSSAVPELSEKTNEKMMETTESTEIAGKAEIRQVKLQEHMQLDSSTPTPEKVALAATKRNETEENEEIKLPAEERSGEDSTRRNAAPGEQNDIYNTLLSEDHIVNGESILHDTLQQNAQDPTVLPLKEQSIMTAEAYKTIDDPVEKFEGSVITIEAVPAADPAEDIEIQKPKIGNYNSSENLSTNKEVLELKVEDQLHQTEVESNQTSSMAEKDSTLVQFHQEHTSASELMAEEFSEKYKPESRMARDEEGIRRITENESTGCIKEDTAGGISPYHKGEKEQELKFGAKQETEEKQYHYDKEAKALPTEEAKQVLVGAERVDDWENTEETNVDNFKSNQDETPCESIPSQISEVKHSNQTTDEASLSEVVNQDIPPTSLAVKVIQDSDTQLQLIQDPGVATSDEITKMATSKTAENDIGENKEFFIAQEAEEEQKERSEKIASGVGLAHQASEEDINKDEADDFSDDVKSISPTKQEPDERREEEVHVDHSDEKTLKTPNIVSFGHSSEEVDCEKFQNFSSQVLHHQPPAAEPTKKESCSVPEGSDLNANESAGEDITDGEIQIVRDNNLDKVEGYGSNIVGKGHETKPENFEVFQANLALIQSHPAAIEEISSVMLSKESNQISSTTGNKKDQSTMINECLVNDNSSTASITSIEEEFLQKEGKTTIPEHTEEQSFSIASSDPKANEAEEKALIQRARIDECNIHDNSKTALGTLEEELLQKEGQSSSQLDSTDDSNEAIKPKQGGAEASKIEPKEDICETGSSHPSIIKCERSMELGKAERLKDMENLISKDLNDSEHAAVSNLSHELGNEFEEANKLALEKFPTAVPKVECSEDICKTEEKEMSEEKLQTATDGKRDEKVLKGILCEEKVKTQISDEKTGPENPCNGSPESEISQNKYQEDALKWEVHPRPETVEISEFVKMPSKYENIEQNCQDLVQVEKDSRKVKETTRIAELQEEGGSSHFVNMNTEVKILNEQMTASAESSQSNLQPPAKEPQQQQDVREAQDQQYLHNVSDVDNSGLLVDTKDVPFYAASANDARAPLQMEKLESLPFSESDKSIQEEAGTNDSLVDSNNILQLQQKANVESFQAEGDNIEASKVKPEEAPHGKEKQTETEPNVQKEETKDVNSEMVETEELKTNEEEEAEEKKEESAYDSPVTVEAPDDIDIKAAHKKSHNILSGVGSKVKHSLKKVKKAITGKSSHPKPSSPK